VDQNTTGDLTVSLNDAVSSVVLSDPSGPMVSLTGPASLAQSYNFVAGTTYTLTAQTDSDNGDSGSYNVTLLVPEPTAVCLLVFGGLAVLRRKRR